MESGTKNQEVQSAERLRVVEGGVMGLAGQYRKGASVKNLRTAYCRQGSQAESLYYGKAREAPGRKGLQMQASEQQRAVLALG